MNVAGSSPVLGTYVEMAEMADAVGSKPAPEWGEGSNPSFDTNGHVDQR